MRLKHGVQLQGVRPEVAVAMLLVQCYFATRFSDELVITSVTEDVPDRVRGSLHHVGQAFDFRWPAVGTAADVVELKNILGPQFDLVLEVDHAHVEFQPK